MTQQDDKKTLEMKIPDILEEEDTPFPSKNNNLKPIDQNLQAKKDINDKIKWFQYETGRNVLYITMLAMVILVIVEMIVNINGIKSTLLTNAFEAFKLIAMTAVGFILGTNVSN